MLVAKHAIPLPSPVSWNCAGERAAEIGDFLGLRYDSTYFCTLASSGQPGCPSFCFEAKDSTGGCFRSTHLLVRCEVMNADGIATDGGIGVGRYPMDFRSGVAERRPATVSHRT